MASDRKQDGLLNGELAEEARGLQPGDPRRRRYSSPTVIVERIQGDVATDKRSDRSETT
jgi:hypothetical protein